ncbi:SAM-dependent methyltransferase [Catelliglobosispora koreensis]|uniref:SAM-dependent methyltransferase n=1 Tax=Catelliglobosispora koreensis TaxID=129052 RepID=UPI00035F1854|nr:class I SAM-dependent methyltransferase [Catelliglobosispora koreensis]
MTESDGPTWYAHLSFNAPLSEHRANDLAARLAAARPADVLDIGCGWGELMLRVLEHAPSAVGTGIDTDERGLARGRMEAEKRGLTDRATFRTLSGEETQQQADVVICIGASHAFGGPAQALSALRTRVRPGGRLLFGEGLWDPTGPVPEPELVWPDLFELPTLRGLVDVAVEAGYRPLYTEESSLNELDAFESGYLADYEEWLIKNPAHPRAQEVRAQSDEHRRRWLHGYRGAFGFAYLTLGVPLTEGVSEL